MRVKISTGQDYLRLEKNSGVTITTFKKIYTLAPKDEDTIYDNSEREALAYLPSEFFIILKTNDLVTIKERFRVRMHGNQLKKYLRRNMAYLPMYHAICELMVIVIA